MFNEQNNNDENIEHTYTLKNKPYKVMPGDVVRVNRHDIIHNNIPLTFYHLSLKHKDHTGNEKFYNKFLKFKSGVELANGTYIKLKEFFEIPQSNARDPYNPRWGLFVLEFDIEQDHIEYESEYQDEVKDYQGNNTADMISDDIFASDELPF